MAGFKEKFGETLGSAKSALERRFKPVEYIKEDVPFIETLGLPKKAIEWIAKVKRDSKRAAEEKPSGVYVTAFDLVRLHLLMERDLKDLGPNLLSKQTEHLLDEILNQIFAWYKKHPYGEGSVGVLPKGGFVTDYYEIGIPYLIAKAETSQDKLSALTKIIDRWHSETNKGAGTNPTFRGPVIGVNEGEKGDRAIRGADLEFYNNLDNLSNPEQWH